MSQWLILERSKIDDQKWNEAVGKSSNELIYGYTSYLDIVASGWCGLVYGDYEAVLSVSLKSKLGLKYIGQINHVQRLNIFTSLTQIPDLLNLQEIIIKSTNYIDVTTEEKLFSSLTFTEKANFILPLNGTKDILQKGFNTNTNRRIKKAIKNGASIEKCPDISIVEAINLFRSQKEFKISNEWFQELKLLSESNFSEIYCVRHNNEEVAYAMVLISKMRVTLLFTAMGEQGRELGAMHNLISELIFKFSNSNKTFDFEGSDNPGIARFYSSFGAIKEKYYHYQSNGILKRTKELLKRK